VTSSVPFTLLASGLHKYPLTDRFLLFIVPCVVLVIAAGAQEIIDKSRRNLPIMAIATLGLLFLHPVFYASYHLTNPRTKEEIRPVIEFVNHRRSPDDVLYVYYGAQNAFEYYKNRNGFADQKYIVGVASRHNVSKYFADLERLRGNKRVWIIFSHVHSETGVDEEKFLLLCLESLGTRLDVFKRDGAAAYLYDLSVQGQGVDNTPFEKS
jgi:hypothetical protein